jgi:hypothetical protein
MTAPQLREPITDVIPLVPAQRAVEEFQVMTIAEAAGMQMWRRDPAKTRTPHPAALLPAPRPMSAPATGVARHRAPRPHAEEPWPTALGGRRRRTESRWWRRG